MSVSLLLTVLRLSPSFLPCGAFMLRAVIPQHPGRVRSRKLLRNQNWCILRYSVFCISRQGGLTVYHTPTWKDFGQILKFGKSIMTTLRYQVSFKAENYQLMYSQRLDGMIRVTWTHFYSHSQPQKFFQGFQAVSRGCSVQTQSKILPFWNWRIKATSLAIGQVLLVWSFWSLCLYYR